MKRTKVVKAWAVLNIQGNIQGFDQEDLLDLVDNQRVLMVHQKKKEALSFVHKDYVVPCTISYQLPVAKKKRKKPSVTGPLKRTT